MGWLDFLIIYLACGTPFAVYRIALSELNAAETAARSIKAALLWPIDGGKATLKRLRQASRSLSKPRLEIIRSQIEELLIEDATHFRVFEFREVFDRYSGLARVAAEGEHSPTAFLEIAGVGATSTAEACRSRIASAKMERHTTAARREILEYVGSSRSDRILSLAASLAAEVSDGLLAAEISKRLTTVSKQGRSTIQRLSGSAS